MTQSSRCPGDRNKLLLIIENRAPEPLRTHVDECERCRLEVRELVSAIALVPSTPGEAPSANIRREVTAYARSQVRTPYPGRQWWRVPLSGAAGVFFAVLFGGLAEARMTSSTPEIIAPDPWTLALAILWGFALVIYSWMGEAEPRGQIVKRAMVGVGVFTLLTIAFPMSAAVDLFMTWKFGTGELSAARASWGFGLAAICYSVVAGAGANRLSGYRLSFPEACWAACVFGALATPLLLMQAAPYIPMSGVAGLACGAWIGERLGSRR
jgi:hypothetical protein